MQRIVHISDTHFGTERPEVEDALVESINKLQPQLLILSGDITQRARRWQFKKARSFLEQLQYEQLLCIPGNHDIPLYNLPLRIAAPYASYNKHMKGLLNTYYQCGNTVVQGLNSCNPWHYKNGHLKTSTLSQSLRRLQALPDHYLKIVVSHHPFDAIKASDESNIVRDAEESMDSLIDAGVDVILSGHIHHQFCRSLQVRYPQLERNIISCQAGTALSHRTRSELPNSFMELEIGSRKSGLAIKQWDFDSQEGGFQVMGTHHPFG